MKLIATKPMRYGTRHLVAGDSFETEKEIHGRILMVGRKAKKAPVVTRRRKVVAELSAEEEKPSPDLTAQDSLALNPTLARVEDLASRPGNLIGATVVPVRGGSK